jgi:hypothetical protein
MEANICLLVIGDLGETGKLSLSTIMNVNPKKICVAANPAGTKWIENNTPQALRDRICMHNSLLENFEYKQFDLKSEYSEYRSSDFRILTLLKWDLISDSMKHHQGSATILFSDLDVYWFKDPSFTIDEMKSSKSDLYIQNDASDKRPQWCCTGVMFWRNSISSLSSISELRSWQKRKIEEGNLQDDEDTFNQFLVESSNPIAFTRLPESEYIVGRNFAKMFLARNYRNQKVCFHANYLTGLTRKFRILSSVHKYFQQGVFPIQALVHFMLMPKLRRLTDGVKRRLKR